MINRKILIDAPFDIYHQIKKYNIDPRELSHILITHPHDDHIVGLYDLSHIYNRKTKIKLVTSRGVLSKMRRLVGTSMRSFEIVEAKPFEKVQLDTNSSCWFIPVEHGSVEAYGIKVKAPKPAFYAVEFRRILPSSKKFIGDIDIAIIDGSSKTSFGQAKGHETIEEGMRLGRDIHTKKILFTNIGHKTDRHEDLDGFVKQNGGSKFSIAFDGLEVTL